MVSSSVLTHHQFFVNPESNPQHLFVAPKNLHRLTICPAPQARIQCFLRRKTSFRRLERLEKDEKKGKADFKSRMKTSSWMALVASFSGAIPGFIFPGIWVWCWVFLQGVLYTTASEMWFYQNVIRAPPDVRSGYTRWIEFAWMLSQLQDRTQEKLNNYTNSVLQAGISTDQGMYGVLKSGIFLQRTIEQSEFSIESTFESVIRLKLLAAILRAQSVFILRQSDPCTQSGPNGAFDGKNVLSYCGPDKVMMNIVRAKGTKTHRKIYNAPLIQSKYGFSVSFLTTAAWKCQTKYGGYEHDPYTNSPLPADINAECLFNLPVCDCNSTAVATERAKGVRTVKACLEAGVPIHPTGPQYT